MKKLCYFFGLCCLMAGFSAIDEFTRTFEFGLLILAIPSILIGILLFKKGKSIEPKPKKQTYSFVCEIKGTFLDERQRILSRLYLDNFDKEIDTDNEVLISNHVYFQDEPDNEHDPNAIAIVTKQNEKLGYVPRESTAEFRQTIDRNLPFKTYLTIKKYYDADEDEYEDENKITYYADVQALQIRK